MARRRRAARAWPKRIAILMLLAAAGYVLAGGWILADRMETLLAVREAPLPQPTDDPFQLGYRGDPQAALGLRFQEVTLEGAVSAWYVPSDGLSSVAAVYVHGLAGAREDGYRHLSVLNQAGIPTLLLAYRNDPEGLYAFGLTEWRDLEAAVRHLRERGFARILLVGESMGGAIVGQFLQHSEEATAVAGLILDSPALDFPGLLRAQAGERGLPLPGLVSAVALKIFALRNPLDLRAAEVSQVVESFPGPVFLAHGSGDALVPVAGSDRAVTRRHGATLYLRGDAGHLLTWQENPALYRSELLAFLRRF